MNKWCVKLLVKVWDIKCFKYLCDIKWNVNFLYFNFYCRLVDYIFLFMKKWYYGILVWKYVLGNVYLFDDVI